MAKGNLEGGGDGFSNTSRVLVEHGHSLIITREGFRWFFIVNLMKTNENQRLLMKTNERKEKSDHLEFILMMVILSCSSRWLTEAAFGRTLCICVFWPCICILALLLLCEAIFLAAEIILHTMSNEMPAARWRSQRS